jgi:hypothetical protein
VVYPRTSPTRAGSTLLHSLGARRRLLFRNRGWLLFAIGGALLIASWLFVPSVYKPYVRVHAPKVAFTLDCVPQSVALKVLTPYAATRDDASIAVLERGAHDPKQTFPIEVIKSSREGGPLQVTIEPPKAQWDAIEALTATLRNARITVIVNFERIPNIDLESIQSFSRRDGGAECNGEYRGKDLLRILPGQSAELMRTKLIQEELSNIVYGFNTWVSNFLLAGMTVALVWFGYVLSTGAVAAYVSSSNSIRKALAKRVESAPARLRRAGEAAFLKAEFILTNRRLAFAKTMGPALGFLLTVSSLSAALHPSVQATQDTFRFVSGIQIAVIATFVGLAIRIVAQWAQRVHVDLAERLLALLADEQDASVDRHDG